MRMALENASTKRRAPNTPAGTPAKVHDGDMMEEDLPFLTPIYEELPSTGPSLTVKVLYAAFGQFAAHHDRLLTSHGKQSIKLSEAEKEIVRLLSRVAELEAAADKTGDMAMDSVSKGDIVELQGKIAKIMEAVQSNTVAVKKEAAETVLMRAELIKIKANSMQASQQSGEVHQEGAGSYAATLKGPSARPTMQQFLKAQSESARLAEEVRRASGRIRGLSAVTVVEAEKAVTGLLAELGIAASDLWNIILLSPGAHHNSVIKFTTLHKETRVSIFKQKRTLKGMGYVLTDDLTPEMRAEKVAMTPVSIRLWNEGWIVRWRDSTLQFLGRLTAGGLHGWHNWSEGVPAAGNTRPRPSEDKPAGDSVNGEGGKSE